jgi:4-hydroxybenzoate polyprenyltransferase
MRWFHFILSHSIFVSLCAIALCYQTMVLLNLRHDSIMYGFVFFATLSSYNFYWLLSKYSFGKPVELHVFVKKNSSYILLTMLSGTAMLYCLSFLAGIHVYAAFAAVLTIIYSMPLWPLGRALRLRKPGMFKTILLAFTWSYVTVFIPALPLINVATEKVIMLMITRFCFVGMLCILFDKRDMAADKLLGLRSLATDVGTHRLKMIMLVCMAGYLVAAGILLMLSSNNLHFFAFILSGVMVLCAWHLSSQKRGYLFYYFGVDGLMLFSAAGTFVATLLS